MFLEKQSDSSLFYADKGIEYSIKNNSHLGHLLNLQNKGIFHEEVTNKFDLAAEIYFECISIAEKHKKDYISTLYNDLCLLFTKKGDYEKAIIYGKKAIETSFKGKGVHLEQSALMSLGVAQSLAKKYNEAQKTFDKYLQFKDEREVDKNVVYLRIAKNLKEQGFNQKAQALFLKTISLDSLKGQREFSQEYMQLIENSILLKDKNTVEKYLPFLNKSIENERSLNNKKDAYKTLALASNFLGNSKKAYEFQDKLLKATDSINAWLNKKQILELETKYQTKKKEEQILEEQSKKKLWSSISIAAFIILIIVAILLYKNSHKRKQLNKNKLELEKLLNQRNMLLRETHHRVKNSFQMVSSLLQLQAQGSEAEAAVTALNNAVERVNSMIVLHQQLYAKDNILGVDLKRYVDDLINEILSSYLSENIQIKSNAVSTVLDIDTATSIGLLVNELATNSIKYAWSETDTEKIITLNIDEMNGNFQFKMFDNGTSKKTKITRQNYGSELIEILIERLNAEKLTSTENDFGLHITFKKENV
jgi:two-component sensor histidine kinase